ncbi:hypothetical protein NMG60_11031260 [Bertholletia excelsa]
MPKLATLFVIALVLFLMLTSAPARPGPPMGISQHGELEAEKAEIDEEESCREGDKEECLMRRTLAAHVDYIYTQKHPKP